MKQKSIPSFSLTDALALTKVVALTTALAVGLSGCGDAKKVPSTSPTMNVPTMKPDRVAVTQVGLAVLGEVSHIERAIKPFIGLELPGAPSEVAGLGSSGDCKKTQATGSAQWETQWRCGLNSTDRGRKEIEGVERLSYDQALRTLTYSATFEIRNFEDREARAKAHTLFTGRKVYVTFAAGSSSVAAVANVRIISSATLNTMDGTRKGSNWSSSIGGVIRRNGTIWTMDKGALVAFKGSLYGLDGLRNTEFAAGEFNLVSEADIALTGLGDTACTKAVGTWKVTSSGGGARFDTRLASTTGAISENSGGSQPWPANLCAQP